MNPKKFALIKRVENGWLFQRANEVGQNEESYVAVTVEGALEILKEHLELDLPEILEPESPISMPYVQVEEPKPCPECKIIGALHLPGCSKYEVPF
jgi:hypothetical protein